MKMKPLLKSLLNKMLVFMILASAMAGIVPTYVYLVDRAIVIESSMSAEQDREALIMALKVLSECPRP